MKLFSLRLYGKFIPPEGNISCEGVDWSQIFPQSLTQISIGANAMCHSVIARHLCQLSGLRELELRPPLSYEADKSGPVMSPLHSLLDLLSPTIEFLPKLVPFTPNVRRITARISEGDI